MSIVTVIGGYGPVQRNDPSAGRDRYARATVQASMVEGARDEVEGDGWIAHDP